MKPPQSDFAILDCKLDLFYKTDSIKSVNQNITNNKQLEDEYLWVNENVLI